MVAAHDRNRTERTRSVASLGDLQVSVVTGICQDTFTNELVFVVGVELFEKPREVTRPEPCVDIGDLFFKVVLVTLRKAAGHIDFFDKSFFLRIDIAKDGVDGLLLCIVDEATRVDHDDGRIIFSGLVHGVDAVSSQLGEQNLRVHLVFGTTQCNDVHLCFLISPGSHGFCIRDAKLSGLTGEPLYLKINGSVSVQNW